MKAAIWVLASILAVIVIGAVSCAAVLGAGASAVNDSIKQAEQPVTYRYSVEGRGKATIMYLAEAGSSNNSDVPLPFQRDETFTGLFDLPMVSATLGTGGGSVTCRVLDPTTGAVLAENTASGQFASCSASPPPRTQ